MKTLFHGAKLIFGTIILIIAFLVFGVYMIPGAILGFFVGRKCPKWIVYALGFVLAVVFRIFMGYWLLRFGDASDPVLSVTGIIVGILNSILAYAFVWSGFSFGDGYARSKK